MSKKRTPGPYWINRELQDPKDNPDLHYNLIMAPTPEGINQGTPSECVIATVDNADKDAEFIIKACNSHDRLVRALKEANSFIENYGNDRHLAEHPDSCSHCVLLKQIEQALREAGEDA